jgi:hypothetical protein
MTQISILNGTVATLQGDFNTSYPRNLIPVPKQTGVSSGYLKTFYGVKSFGVFDVSLLGVDRGGINWNGKCYRVIGQYFVRVEQDGSFTTLGTLPITGNYVRFDFSFDRLAIACGGNLYYWNGTTLVQVTDVDLKTVIDMLFVDGYFMTTDGQYFIVTDINDPMSVNPLNYGANPIDPSPIKSLLKVRDEVYSMSRYTIAPLQNIGGALFPFEVIKGAIINRGILGTRTACVFMETIAFLGSGLNEQPSIYLVNAGTTLKIATRDIEQLLNKYSETTLSNILMESISIDVHQLLFINLPDQTLVYDGAASQSTGSPVWFYLGSSTDGKGQYRAHNFVRCYDKWLCGDNFDARKIGYLTDETFSQYGDSIGYQFDTPILYGDGKQCILHALDLEVITPRPQYDSTDNVDQYVRKSYSTDGINFSVPKQKSLGRAGQFNKNVQWRQNGLFRQWRIERFQGLTKSPTSFVRLEGEFEVLG